jgi:hypothetical protein
MGDEEGYTPARREAPAAKPAGAAKPAAKPAGGLGDMDDDIPF